MNLKKKSDNTFINAAALQDHYLRSVNINIKPTFISSNRTIQRLKR